MNLCEHAQITNFLILTDHIQNKTKYNLIKSVEKMSLEADTSQEDQVRISLLPLFSQHVSFEGGTCKLQNSHCHRELPIYFPNTFTHKFQCNLSSQKRTFICMKPKDYWKMILSLFAFTIKAFLFWKYNETLSVFVCLVT